MESKIKLLLSRFLNKEVSAINSQTVIDRTSLRSSIMVHRFYAELLKNGASVEDYLSIRTFGDLMNRLKLRENVSEASKHFEQEKPLSIDEFSIGIDIESVDNLPVCVDYREEPFYKMNFSQKEISYCLIQMDPRLSFAGLFAAKEAIVKASHRHRGTPFYQIEINHDSSGKPVFPLLNISISKKDNYAIAVATLQMEEQLLALTESNKKLSDELNRAQQQLTRSVTHQKKYILTLASLLLLMILAMIYLAIR